MDSLLLSCRTLSFLIACRFIPAHKLFHYNCSACHGPRAEGIGNVPPLVSTRVQTATPGALKWVLRNGSLTTGMPSFSKLPEAQRWQIITYIQSLNSR
ncbi:MAG TPA: cytochrome c [Candidatus Acidoferrales bacterium]|nr:cytochrome c [Candidatus Acidoferrales bacterium]